MIPRLSGLFFFILALSGGTWAQGIPDIAHQENGLSPNSTTQRIYGGYFGLGCGAEYSMYLGINLGIGLPDYFTLHATAGIPSIGFSGRAYFLSADQPIRPCLAVGWHSMMISFEQDAFSFITVCPGAQIRLGQDSNWSLYIDAGVGYNYSQHKRNDTPATAGPTGAFPIGSFGFFYRL